MKTLVVVPLLLLVGCATGTHKQTVRTLGCFGMCVMTDVAHQSKVEKELDAILEEGATEVLSKPASTPKKEPPWTP